MNTTIDSYVYSESRHASQAPTLTISHPSCGTLHLAGDTSLLTERAVAVVGSRKATPAALGQAAAIAVALVEKGLVVISGLAAGVDSAAHHAAIRAGGRTIAVIGTSLGVAYPASNASLQERISQDHLLVSPFARGSLTAPWHFPVRDRVIARLALATVLVQADEKSGTRYVVEESIRQGKMVFAQRGLLQGLTWLRRAAARGVVVEWDQAEDLVASL
jgi:DNA processing protein